MLNKTIYRRYHKELSIVVPVQRTYNGKRDKGSVWYRLIPLPLNESKTRAGKSRKHFITSLPVGVSSAGHLFALFAFGRLHIVYVA
jgi:hypothetical protein